LVVRQLQLEINTKIKDKQAELEVAKNKKNEVIHIIL
jgi:hypothetical protein